MTAMSAAQIRAGLADLLPGYMVPAEIAIVPALPLLVSGKLDRKKVLELFSVAPDDSAAEPVAAEPPAGDAEQAVAAVWEQVLGRAVGATTTFFEAGGNSLLLIRLREALRGVFDADISVTDLFRHPTVRAMAVFLGGGPESGTPATGAAEAGRSRQEARATMANRRRRNAR